MRIRKRKDNQGMPPDQVEALGRMGADGWAKARQITKQLLGMPPVKVEAPEQTALQSWIDQSPDTRGHFARVAAAAESGARSRRDGGDPPLLTGGESPQDSQTGESIVLDRNGNPVIRPGVRCIKGQKVGIDWVSCVFEPSEAWRYAFFADGWSQDDHKSEDHKNAEFLKQVFGWILGLSKADQKNPWKVYENGLNGYKYAVGMPLSAGVVHVGHTSGTVLVTVSGQGALMAAPGWESRLHSFLKDVRGWLTRIDMAFDDFEGEYFPVRVMREQAREGAFARGGRPPKIELRGAWEQDDPNDSGLTLYIGTRMAGKFTRIYEKGKQLGDEASPWVRAEVELHNSCYQLTLDMLLHPTSWFVAFYPVFEVIQYAGNRSELEYRNRIAVGTLEHSEKWIRHQAGGHLAALRQFYSDTELLDRICRADAIPESFRVANFACETILAPSASLTDEPGWIEA
jgi:phage replication initiation protein